MSSYRGATAAEKKQYEDEVKTIGEDLPRVLAEALKLRGEELHKVHAGLSELLADLKVDEVVLKENLKRLLEASEEDV
jgi:hypothetical protein